MPQPDSPLTNVVRMPRSRDWHDALFFNGGKPPRPIPNLANCLIALRAAPEWEGVLNWNDFKHRIDIAACTPWGKSVRSWDDNDDAKTAEWLQQHDIQATTHLASEAVKVIAHEHTINPLLDWLASLEWDGTPRIHEWMSELLGVEANDYSSLVGRKWLISAVARAYQPGCKADCCLILEGPQGIRKSSALKLLAGGSEFFTDFMGRDLGSKEAAILCSSVWVIEFAELSGVATTPTGIETVKAFLSRTDDRYRPHYGRHPISVPRQCVFAASTNTDAYLMDVRNRRFWPVLCGEIRLDRIATEREQLWAEAVDAYVSRGERWWLEGVEDLMAEGQQKSRVELDAWHERVIEWVGSKPHISTAEVLEHCIRINLSDRTRSEDMRVARILKIEGWEKYRVPGKGNSRWRREVRA